MLRYLFSQERKTRDQTEIIIMLTPHIIRMPVIQEVNMRGLNTGSEQIPRLRSPQALGLGRPATAAPAPTTPAVPAAPTPGGAPAAVTPPAAAPATPPVTAPAPPATQPPAAAAPNAAPSNPRTTNSTVSFAPSPLTLPATGTATVNIVGNGTDFYGVDLTLAFDPKAISVREVREGGFLSRDGQIVAFVQRMETENGTLRLSLERPPGVAPLSGTGNLVTLVLQRGAQPGPSTLRITEFRIRDAQQNVSVGRTAEVSVSAP
jgi:hypothetical protein